MAALSHLDDRREGSKTDMCTVIPSPRRRETMHPTHGSFVDARWFNRPIERDRW